MGTPRKFHQLKSITIAFPLRGVLTTLPQSLHRCSCGWIQRIFPILFQSL